MFVLTTRTSNDLGMAWSHYSIYSNQSCKRLGLHNVFSASYYIVSHRGQFNKALHISVLKHLWMFMYLWVKSAILKSELIFRLWRGWNWLPRLLWLDDKPACGSCRWSRCQGLDQIQWRTRHLTHEKLNKNSNNFLKEYFIGALYNAQTWVSKIYFKTTPVPD